MTRTVAREIAIHCAYTLSLSRQPVEEFLSQRLREGQFENWSGEASLYQEFPDPRSTAYIQTVVRGVAEHGSELDEYIARRLRGWDFARLPVLAVVIMRVAMYEILYMPEIPQATSIDEAVEIGKRYLEQKDVSFINGVLASFLASEMPDDAISGSPEEREGEA